MKTDRIKQEGDRLDNSIGDIIRGIVFLGSLFALFMFVGVFASSAAFGAPATPPEVGIGTIVQGAGATVQAFGTSTVLGLAALVNVLTNVLKLPFIRNLLVEHKKRWLIPIFSMALGVAAALTTSLVQGQPWLDAVLAGLMAGGLAIGGNEALKLRRKEKRRA